MKQQVRKVINKILTELNYISDFELKEPPEGINGDLSTNIPLCLSKKLKKSPKEVAEEVISIMNQKYSDIFNRVEFSSPGFINFFLDKKVYLEEVKNIIKEKESYPIASKKDEKVLIEFVSSNPTGPLHIGHGRCAVIGDVLANILKQQGYEVYKEYYINDRGRQINILTASVLKAMKEFGANLEEEVYSWGIKVLSDGEYKGEYIKDVARKLTERFKNKIHFSELNNIKVEVVNIVMEEIKDSLVRFRVLFDNYYSEESLYRDGLVEKMLSTLKQKDLVEEKENALWFKAKELGDDKDRVLVRNSGEPTYFLSDIAYHITKLSRGYNWLINIWGTDHHGYVKRLKSAVSSVVKEEFKFDIILYQLVSILKNGQRIAMSTREGKFITLTEVMEEVGVDVTRYFLITKTPNTHLDFDFDLAKEHSLKNPVYYIQYAHTRCCGILREAKVDDKMLGDFSLVRIDEKTFTEQEDILIKKLCGYEDVLSACVSILSPHLLCSYLLDLSRVFHKFYESCRVIDTDAKVNFSRAVLVYATKIVLSNGLKLLGIEAPEKM